MLVSLHAMDTEHIGRTIMSLQFLQPLSNSLITSLSSLVPPTSLQLTVNGVTNSAFSSSTDSHIIMSTPIEIQRFELLNYTSSNGEELVGLVVELVEDPSEGFRVRVLRDSNVVSCVSVVPLKECRVDDSQGCNCCD